MKKVFAILLTLVMTTMLVSSIALAEEQQSGNFIYKLKGNGTAVIVGYNWENNQGADIHIPRMIDGYTVTEIGDEAFTKLSYDGNGVIEAVFRVSIGNLTIPDTVVRIGKKAFMNTYFEAMSVTIPASVEYIGAGAFSNCAVEQFVVDGNNPIYATINGALYNKQKKELVAFPAQFSVTRSYTMQNGVTYSPISIPEGIVGIGDYAMFGLGNVGTGWNGLHYQLPSTLEYIGDYAFAHNKGFGVTVKLEGYKESTPVIILPDSVSSIGEGAFYRAAEYGNFDHVYQIILNNTHITEIPQFAFYKIDTFEPVLFPETLISIGDRAFYSDSYSRGTVSSFPSSLQYIGNEAFCYNDLDGFAFPGDSSLISIGDGAFRYCESSFSGTITLPDGLVSIGAKAFYDIEDLEKLVLPASVEEIGDEMCDYSSVTLDVVDGSYASTWAFENGYTTNRSGNEDTSWLN